MNKAEHFLRTGQGICDECDGEVEARRTAGKLGPFLCQRCADIVMQTPALFGDGGSW